VKLKYKDDFGFKWMSLSFVQVCVPLPRAQELWPDIRPLFLPTFPQVPWALRTPPLFCSQQLVAEGWLRHRRETEPAEECFAQRPTGDLLVSGDCE
jgi:hypothetical protein